MTKTIEVQDEDVALLVDIYTKQLASVREQKKELDDKERSLIDKLKRLGSPVDALSPIREMFTEAMANAKQVTYNLQGTIVGKIRFVLNESGKEMSTSQIVNRLYELDAVYREDPKKTAKNVSSVLSVNHGTGKPFKRTEDANGVYLFSINK